MKRQYLMAMCCSMVVSVDGTPFREPKGRTIYSLGNAVRPIAKNENNSLKLIPDGYKLQNVPGDGLCGYWALLVSKKAKNLESETVISVSKKEIRKLLKRLSAKVAYVLGKKNKTQYELEMVEEIDQLIHDHYAENYGDLYQKIEAGSLQLISPLTLFLAQEMECDIVIKSAHRRGRKTFHDTNLYDSGHQNAKKI
jgi:hypothetical protein